MRAFLGGRGLPREEFAILGIGESGGAPVILLLEDGEVFAPEDYISLGYTNYEVWCVGASGGRGGDATGVVEWRTMKTVEVMPGGFGDGSIWADYLDEKLSVNGPYYVYSGTSPAGTPMPPAGVISWEDHGTYIQWQLYPQGLAELQNPDHTATVTHYLEPLMYDPSDPFAAGHTYLTFGGNVGRYIGGGGGGGGLHVVHGLLSDLPSSLVAEVGTQGADGALGQAIQAAAFDPSPAWSLARYPMHTINEDRWNWLNRFPNGHPTIGLPAEGSPGGVSSFGDIAKASGGKGGKPAIQWAGSVRQLYAAGGQGGIGGSDIAGGGADGAITSTSDGKDGSWDGAVGKGGGGGRGGKTVNGSGNPPSSPSISATQGGRGSLNFADTSVYGARGPLGTYLRTRPNYDPVTGDLISIIEAVIAAPINPGGGGGARIPGNRKYGSRAQGYSHDGAVLVRLTKLV